MIGSTPRAGPRLRATLFLLTLLLPLPALAGPEQEGRLFARVFDEAGEAVGGVRITVEAASTVSPYTTAAVTDKKGRFRLLVTDATVSYRLRFEAEGFHVLEATVKLQAGKTSQGSFTLKRLVPGAGERAAALFNEGVEALAGGDRAGAEEKLRAAVADDPLLAPAHGALAEIYLDSGRPAEAMAAVRRAAELDPQTVRYLSTLYAAQRALKDEAGAAETLARIRAKGGDSRLAAELYNEAALPLSVGALERAREKLELAAALDPQLAAAHLGLARVAQGQGRHGDAAAAAGKALELEPGNARALAIRRDSLAALGSPGAGEALEALAAADPAAAARSLLQEGQAAYQAGENERARERFEGLLALDPDHPRAHYMLGLLAANEGRAEDARRHLARFVALAPDDPDAGAARALLAELAAGDPG